jgi:hypothetical protein
VFNAALEQPGIAQFLAVMHPVGHDVARYARIAQPALLVYDTADAGHPVAVGRQAKRHLRDRVYVEHSSDRHPHFHEAFFAPLLLQLFAGGEGKRGGAFRIKSAMANSAKLPSLTTVAGGLHAWARPTAGELQGPSSWARRWVAGGGGSGDGDDDGDSDGDGGGMAEGGGEGGAGIQDGMAAGMGMAWADEEAGWVQPPPVPPALTGPPRSGSGSGSGATSTKLRTARGHHVVTTVTAPLARAGVAVFASALEHRGC